jgi:hypothetical protein
MIWKNLELMFAGNVIVSSINLRTSFLLDVDGQALMMKYSELLSIMMIWMEDALR